MSRDAASVIISAKGDIFQTSSFAETASLVADHLNWRQGGRPDNLTSWTSSILFAIQYVFYRHAWRNDPRKRDGSPMADIQIFIVDTTKFESQVFTRDMDLIAALRTGSGDLWRLYGLRTGRLHYYMEYLSQGTLSIKGKCKIVSAQAIIDHGLLSPHPEFETSHQNPECGWPTEVLRVRKSLNDADQASVSSEQDASHHSNCAAL